MDQFFSDRYATFRQENLYYPFTSAADWQLASWLLRSHLSMAAIDDFLSLKLVRLFFLPFSPLFGANSPSQIKQLPLSFRTAKELRLHTEMLPSGPCWQSHTLTLKVATKRKAIVYFCDPVECLQSLLSHPLFTSQISFVPWKVWSSSARVVRIYEDWLSGDHAWGLQVSQSTYSS